MVTWILLLIAFASPYWLSSYSYTYSPFVRLGLWDFCFNNYRHPPYQYDERFHGCHWVYSSKFQNIRDWLQPGEFTTVSCDKAAVKHEACGMVAQDEWCNSDNESGCSREEQELYLRQFQSHQ
jgi:hypothetical protein